MKAGNDIKISPVTRFDAGTEYVLTITDVMAPNDSVEETYFAVTSTWNGLTLSETAATGMTFAPT